MSPGIGVLNSWNVVNTIVHTCDGDASEIGDNCDDPHPQLILQAGGVEGRARLLLQSVLLWGFCLFVFLFSYLSPFF